VAPPVAPTPANEDVSMQDNATINRKFSALKLVLNLTSKTKPPLVDRAPKIRMLKEALPEKDSLNIQSFWQSEIVCQVISKAFSLLPTG